MFIVKAATMYSNGAVIEGRDYGHISSLAHKLRFPTTDKIDGFVTSSGEFVVPSEARKIAVDAGQVSDTINDIAPENLWVVTTMEQDDY